MAEIVSHTKANLSYISQAIIGTQQLRSTVTSVFNLLCEGVKPDEDQDGTGEEVEPAGSHTKDAKKFLHRFQEYLQAVNQDYNEVDKYCTCMTLTPDMSPLGPSGSLSLDSTLDKSCTYRDVSLTYQWKNRLHDYAQIASSIMQVNQMRRSLNQTGVVRRRRTLPSKISVYPHHQIEMILKSMDNQTKGMSIKTLQMNGDTRIVQLTVDRVLTAIIVMRHLYFEKILVKGQDEDITDDHGQVDLFSSSQYESMRRITDHAMSAILDYSISQPSQPDLPLKYITMWMRSYKTLFTDKCGVCGKHLAEGLPPLWRAFRNPVPCHDSCRS